MLIFKNLFKKIFKKITLKKNKAVFRKLKKGTTYYFRVRAVSGSNKGKFSATKKVKI